MLVQVLTLIVLTITLIVLAITARYISKSAKAAKKSAEAAERTAKATNKYVKETERATQAQLYFSLWEYYSSKEMLKSLRLLREVEESESFKIWSQEGPKTFAGGYHEGGIIEIQEEIEKTEKDYPYYKRFVKYYFLRIYHLDEQGFLPVHLVKDLLSVDGIELFFNVVKPLEYLENENFDSSDFDALYERAKKLDIKELPPTLWGPPS